jgi:hypothetical protein
MNALKGRVYDHECPECGYFLRERRIIVRCECGAKFDVVMEHPTGV